MQSPGDMALRAGKRADLVRWAPYTRPGRKPPPREQHAFIAEVPMVAAAAIVVDLGSASKVAQHRDNRPLEHAPVGQIGNQACAGGVELRAQQKSAGIALKIPPCVSQVALASGAQEIVTIRVPASIIRRANSTLWP